MNHPTQALSLAIAIILASSVHAEVYKWVDRDGGINYSEHKPPKGTAVETITPWTSAPSAERATLEARIEASDKRRTERAEREKKQGEEKAHADKIANNCKQAKLRLASLERPRINKVNEDGTLSRMPEEWRQDQMLEAHAAIEKYCQ